jgi:protein SCO1/2
MLRILLIGLVVLVVAMLLIGRQTRVIPEPSIATVLPEPRALPETAFIDATGQGFTTSDLEGNFTLLFFGFTNCPDICPLTLQILADVDKILAARQAALTPRVVFVSVDPNRDTPSVIEEYLAHFSADFVGLTATDDDLAPLLASLGVTVHKTEVEGSSYNMVHNGSVFVLDSDAQWIALFGGSTQDARAIATDFVRIRLRHGTRTAHDQENSPRVFRVASE